METIKSKGIFLLIACLTLLGIFIALGDTLGGLRPLEEGAVSNPTGSSVISLPAADDLAGEQPDNLSFRWFNSQKPEKLKGVALVIHGLNLDPDRMGPIINNLTRSGIDVLGLSLRGHGANYAHRDDMDATAARMTTFKYVSYSLWANEAYLAYMQVELRAQQRQVPVFLVAFSLGGLIGLDLLVSNPDVHFDKAVLLAPAVSLRATIYLERALSWLPRLVIPSLANEAYLANKKGTPVAAYNALFEALYHFEENAGPKLNLPTLVFIDEQDEFIPLWGLKNLVEEHNLDKWKFYTVQKEEEMGGGTFHHHIIDASSTGEGVWRDMMATTTGHLLEAQAK
ncbi:MAG: alpha/beta fold hydrolase [Desulfobacterales bacterium]